MRYAGCGASFTRSLAAVALVFSGPLCNAQVNAPERLIASLSGLAPGEWRELPNTVMNQVFPASGATTWGVLGPIAVVQAWGGAAYDTNRNAFLFNGGGHADYGGNEVYAFFLEQLRWQRLTEPSRMRVLPSGQYVTLDGAPVSAHTYDGLEYLPNVDRVFRNGGSEWRSGKNFDRSAWLFDVQNRIWERRSSGGGGYPGTAYDPRRGTVYVVGNSYVDEYDPKDDAWARRLKSLADFQAEVVAIDANARRLITNSYRPGLIIYEINPDGSLSDRVLVKTSGAVEWDKRMRGLEYDPVRKVAVAWAGGRETAYLDTRTLVWRRHGNSHRPHAPVATSERDYPASGMIHGRWRYVPKYDIFIGYNNPRGNVWVWKPQAADAGDATPPAADALPVVQPLLERLKPGQTVVLPPGRYKEAATVSASNVVIKAHGVRLEDTAVDGKAALVVQADNVTIEGLECAGIRVADRNGACVRLEGKNLTLRAVAFRDSQSGLLTWNRDSGTVLIEDSRFERLGRAHGIYIGRGQTHLIVRRSRFLSSTAEGHEIKSRAAKTTIEDSVIASLDGVDSRLLDLPEGGEIVIRRNVLEHGPASSNEDAIGVGLEGQHYLHARNTVLIEENLVIMERRTANVLLHQRHLANSSVRIERNRIIGGTPIRGSNTWFPNRSAARLDAYPALPPRDK